MTQKAQVKVVAQEAEVEQKTEPTKPVVDSEQDSLNVDAPRGEDSSHGAFAEPLRPSGFNYNMNCLFESTSNGVTYKVLWGYRHPVLKVISNGELV